MTNIVNIHGTEAGSVTEGLPEARSMLKKLAMKIGAYTPIGHGASNMLELTEALAKGAEGEQRRQVLANLDRQQNRIAEIQRNGNRKAGE